MVNKISYTEFIESKTKKVIDTGFDIKLEDLNPMLFDWQKTAVQITLKKGRFALFFDCGLGKTIQQLEWSSQVAKHTNKKVLILAPLAVVAQTKLEAKKFNIDISNVDIINYEQLKNLDLSVYSGVVLDESSILKNEKGKTAQFILESFKHFKYKLACTATPSPNDHMELGMHSEFLGAMSYNEMLAMYFVHDSSQTQKWRLKKHAYDEFWKYVCKWSMAVDDPKRFDENVKGYALPEIKFIEHVIKVENNTGNLFNDAAVSATDLHRDLKRSQDDRIAKTVELVNSNNEQWIVWSLSNDEAKKVSKAIEGSVNVEGKTDKTKKVNDLLGFANNEFRVLVTKGKIASFGMNYQNCHNMVFTSYDFKFEMFYQQVRRCYRFGQTEKVKVHILVPESQINVRQTILEKTKKHKEMITEMAKYSADTDYTAKKQISANYREDVITDNYEVLFGDCVERMKDIEGESIDYSFFSPPFGALYVFSDDPNDMSNVDSDDEFWQHFEYLIPELNRVLKKGRLVTLHIMQGTTGIGKDGFYSIKDYRGEIIRLFQNNGFYFHAEKAIRKCPQLAAIRTKNSQLLYGQTKKDQTINRMGLADYCITFRKAGKNEVPVLTDLPFEDWCEMAESQWFTGYVWDDISESDVLKYRAGRDKSDERHITPTQLETIKRCTLLWSNEGDTCLCPFGGIGSEGFQWLKLNRKSKNIELKPSYFDINAKNHKAAMQEKAQLSLF